MYLFNMYIFGCLKVGFAVVSLLRVLMKDDRNKGSAQHVLESWIAACAECCSLSMINKFPIDLSRASFELIGVPSRDTFIYVEHAVNVVVVFFSASNRSVKCSISMNLLPLFFFNL